MRTSAPVADTELFLSCTPSSWRECKDPYALHYDDIFFMEWAQ